MNRLSMQSVFVESCETLTTELKVQNHASFCLNTFINSISSDQAAPTLIEKIIERLPSGVFPASQSSSSKKRKGQPDISTIESSTTESEEEDEIGFELRHGTTHEVIVDFDSVKNDNHY